MLAMLMINSTFALQVLSWWLLTLRLTMWFRAHRYSGEVFYNLAICLVFPVVESSEVDMVGYKFVVLNIESVVRRRKLWHHLLNR